MLLATDDTGAPVGVAVLRLQPSLWSEALEAYLQAQRAYEAAGFRRTEGDGGPLRLAYERDL